MDSTSRTFEVWGPTRQVRTLALYVRGAVQRSTESTGSWDPDTGMRQIRTVVAMVYYGAKEGQSSGRTIQVVSPHANTTGAAEKGCHYHRVG